MTDVNQAVFKMMQNATPHDPDPATRKSLNRTLAGRQLLFFDNIDDLFCSVGFKKTLGLKVGGEKAAVKLSYAQRFQKDIGYARKRGLDGAKLYAAVYALAWHAPDAPADSGAQYQDLQVTPGELLLYRVSPDHLHIERLIEKTKRPA